MSIQMDAEFHKGQNGTLFCLVGALEGVGGPSGVSTPKSKRVVQNNEKTPSWCACKILVCVYVRDCWRARSSGPVRVLETLLAWHQRAIQAPASKRNTDTGIKVNIEPCIKEKHRHRH